MGHVLSNEGIKMDRHKAKTITDMEPPRTTKELKMFLSMVNYVSKFLPATSE